MLVTDEGAVICDLAETYGIFDYRTFKPTDIARFAVGLRDDARIKLKMNQTAYSLNTMLLASIVDRLSLLVWSRTKDGEKGKNRPKSILEEMTKPPEKDIALFETPEDFANKWNELSKEAREWQQN